MQYLALPGIMYDVISYTVMYFNRDSYNNIKTFYIDKGIDPYKYYDSFRQGKRKIDPPDELYPFFYFFSDSGKHFTNFSLFSSYYLNSYPFSKFDLSSFIHSLQTPEFHRFCMNYYFQNYSDRINIDRLTAGYVDDCMQAMLVLRRHGDKLQYFYNFIRNFPQLLEHLTDYLEQCYARMQSFHAQFGQDFFEGVYSYYLKNRKDINRALDLTEKDLADISFYTVHLIDHQTMFPRRPAGCDNGMFFFGISSLKNVLGWANYSNLDIFSFCSAFGNEVKRDIILQLAEQEQTVSQLAAVLFTSRSTINRCVVSLYESLVLQISKKIGTETYYSLNPRYFLIMKKHLNDAIDQIIEKMR